MSSGTGGVGKSNFAWPVSSDTRCNSSVCASLTGRTLSHAPQYNILNVVTGPCTNATLGASADHFP
eukprot:2692665-Pleurochrysis_carterae.AAC.2